MRPPLRRLLPLLLAAIGAPLAASEAPVMERVPVGGFTLPPAGNLRLSEGRFELHPKALIGIGWISNVDPGTDAGADEFLRGIAGLGVRYLPNPSLDGKLDLELEQLRYYETDDHDTYAGRLVGQGDYYGPDLDARLRGGWIRSQDALQTNGELAVRDQWGADLRLRRSGDRDLRELEVGWTLIDYRDPTNLFGADEADRDVFVAVGRLGFGTRESGYGFGLAGDYARYRYETHFNGYTGVNPFIFGGIPVGVRAGVFGEIGWEVRHYQAPYSRPSSFDDQVVSWPSGSLGGRWSWEDGSELRVRLLSSVVDSYVSNAEYRLGGDVTGDLYAGDDDQIIIRGGIYHDHDSGAPEGQEVVQRLVQEGELALVHTWVEGLATRLRSRATRVRNEPGDGYNQVTLSVDLAYVY